ncbi:hypothetical protein BN131_2 [Cronobacter malonaticus 681]|nr:hypothetical protein BN131_2 [Cronobacter malonaticus 681]
MTLLTSRAFSGLLNTLNQVNLSSVFNFLLISPLVFLSVL